MIRFSFTSPFFSFTIDLILFTNYSQGYTFFSLSCWFFPFLSLFFFLLAVGRPSHLESNRGPLSKKLISLNIILSASGSRRALTVGSHSLLSILVTILCVATMFSYFSLGHPSSLLFLFSPFPFWRFNFLMRECFQRAGREIYSVYER